MDSEKLKKDFFCLISSYINAAPCESFNDEEAMRLIELSAEHALSGILIPLIIKQSSSGKVLAFKQAVITQMSVQVRKTYRFLDIYEKVQAESSGAICVKGIIMRSFWKEPDLRISCDEDIILAENHFENFSKKLEENGFEIQKAENGEMRFSDTLSPLILEVSKKPFCESGEFGNELDKIFSDFQNHVVKQAVNQKTLLTFDADYNLLYLICHAFKHFIRGGVGIRQICDILIFTKAKNDEINYDFVFENLKRIRAELFAVYIFETGFKYLGFDRADFSFDFSAYDIDCDAFADDIIEAGVFGNSDKNRLHSAQLTYDYAVSGKKNLPILRRVFPEKNVIYSAYPNAEKHKSHYLYYCFVRLISYLREKNTNAKGTISTANKRKRLLEKLEIAGQPPSGISDSETVRLMEKEIALGKQVKLIVTGHSMTPFLADGRDEVLLEKMKEKPRVGDIVFYRRKNGRFILHRVVKIKENCFYAVGDAQSIKEGPIENKQIIAVCTGAVRKGKKIGKSNFVWQFFEKIWIRLVFCRRQFLAVYSFFKKLVG
ncbi:MAG: nucleotidyltransferase family protein [Acutalibacteraceae bacterium]